MRAGMKIGDWAVRARDETTEVSAVVDGFRLWYRFPRAIAPSGSADPFVAAALYPAMLEGRGLEVEAGLTVSPTLLENLRTLQEIHHTWNPALKIVPIAAATAPSQALNAGTLSFFSGGVDSTYTLLKRHAEITHLVFAQGFDFFANAGATGPFSVDDLADLSQFAEKLLKAGGGLPAFVRDSLSPETRRALSVYRKTGIIGVDLEIRLAGEIEGLLAGPPLYEESLPSGGLELRPETKALLERAPRNEGAYRLNRFLLEDAFPLEIARRDESIYRQAVDRNARFAESRGKEFIPVSTNHYAFGYRYNLSRNLTQGSALASIALLLGFPRVFVPAAYSYSQLVPLGSHPLTDPLWSNGSVNIVHEGAEARRLDKIVLIARDGQALANLRVCFDDMNRNCGRCAKCLRTMIPLRLMGVSSAPFPPLPPLGRIRKMSIANDIELIFLKENIDSGAGTMDPALLRALQVCMKRFQRRRLLTDVDEVFLGGAVKKLYLRFARASPGVVRIDATSSG